MTQAGISIPMDNWCQPAARATLHLDFFLCGTTDELCLAFWLCKEVYPNYNYYFTKGSGCLSHKVAFCDCGYDSSALTSA